MKLTAELQTPAGYNDTDEVTLTDSDRYADAPLGRLRGAGQRRTRRLPDRPGRAGAGGGRYRYASADIDGVPIVNFQGAAVRPPTSVDQPLPTVTKVTATIPGDRDYQRHTRYDSR